LRLWKRYEVRTIETIRSSKNRLEMISSSRNKDRKKDKQGRERVEDGEEPGIVASI
jgi:hypothetical protein